MEDGKRRVFARTEVILRDKKSRVKYQQVLDILN